jgi:ABC-type uncharacterized transport system permease subunit
VIRDVTGLVHGTNGGVSFRVTAATLRGCQRRAGLWQKQIKKGSVSRRLVKPVDLLFVVTTSQPFCAKATNKSKPGQ